MMSIFGIILIISMFFYIIKNIKNKNLGKNLYFISIVALLLLDLGYIAKIGSFTIRYDYLFSSINFIFAIYYLIKNRKQINKKDIIVIMVFIIYLLINTLYPLLFNKHYNSLSFKDSWDLYFSTGKTIGEVGFSKHSLGMFARVIIFVFTFYVFSKSVTKKEMVNYSKIIYKLSNIIILLSINEFIITNFIDNFVFRETIFSIFGKDDSTYYMQRITFGGFFSPLLLMSEPSSYVKMLFILCINNIFVFKISNKQKEKIKIIINIIVLLMTIIFSISLSGYIYFFGILFVLFFSLKNKKLKVVISIIIPILIIIMCVISKSRILTLIQSFNYINMPTDQVPQKSEIIRLYSIANNIILFLKNFLIGCGFGTIYCYSAVVTLFTNIGIIGVSIYLYTINYISNIAVKNKFFSWLTLITISISWLFTGHMSYITYLETFAFLILILKNIDIIKRTKKNRYVNIFTV